MPVYMPTLILLLAMTAKAGGPAIPAPMDHLVTGDKLASSRGGATAPATAECAADGDGDGIGHRTDRVMSLDGDCDDPGEAEANTDCNDADPLIYPGSPAVSCDGHDNDCDGLLDEPDSDGDGATDCADDCAPADPSVSSCDSASDSDTDTDCPVIGGVVICDKADAAAAFGCSTTPTPHLLALLPLLAVLRRRRVSVAGLLVGCAQTPVDAATEPPAAPGCAVMVFPPTDLPPGGVQTVVGQLCWDADGLVQPWSWVDPAHGGGSVLRLFKGAVEDTSGPFQALPLDGTVVVDPNGRYRLDACSLQASERTWMECDLTFWAETVEGGVGPRVLPLGTLQWDVQVWD